MTSHRLATLAIPTIIAFSSAGLLVGVIRHFAVRAGVLDIPNRRSSHHIPTPRGGGLAIVVIVLVAIGINVFTNGMPIYAAIAWIVGGGIVGITGFVDDVLRLAVTTRVAPQILAGVALLAVTRGLPPLSFPTTTLNSGDWGWIAGLIGVVWSTNLFNFMDGIDGLAAMQSTFVALASALLFVGHVNSNVVQMPLLALAGASAGFLFWNFPSARIFMGDVGSGFLGFSLAAAALLSARYGAASLWTWMILNGLFVADATVTLLSRLIRGAPVYQAHRSHVYQNLARRWNSHCWVTASYFAVNVTWCLPWAITASLRPAHGSIFLLAEQLPLLLLAVVLGAGKESV